MGAEEDRRNVRSPKGYRTRTDSNIRKMRIKYGKNGKENGRKGDSINTTKMQGCPGRTALTGAHSFLRAH